MQLLVKLSLLSKTKIKNELKEPLEVPFLLDKYLNLNINIMNTVNRDRETLKRLVESYGKQDVLKFVKHLNEESEEYSDGDYIASMLNSMCNSPRYTRANQIADISEDIADESEEDSLLLDFANSWGLEDEPTWVTEEWRDEVLDIVYNLSGYPCVYKLQSDAREYFWNQFQGNYPKRKELIDFGADNNLYYSVLQYNVDNIAIYDFVCYDDGDEELGGFTLVGTPMV